VSGGKIVQQIKENVAVKKPCQFVFADGAAGIVVCRAWLSIEMPVKTTMSEDLSPL